MQTIKQNSYISHDAAVKMLIYCFRHEEVHFKLEIVLAAS